MIITRLLQLSTDKNGTFTVTFKVPASEGGNHQFTFTDGDQYNNYRFFNGFNCPSDTHTSFTRFSNEASATPVLKWQNVTDPSGVTYSLEIAKDATFNIIELQKDGLKGQNIPLPPRKFWKRESG